MNLTPEQIYSELSRFIIGQSQAKRTMAVALRNRWRKQQLTKVEQAVIRPNHALMVGPSGSGKTAIGKQLARLGNSPFVKAEATQFTEVGYIGREVSEIVEDLVTEALSLLRSNDGQDRELDNRAATSRAIEAMTKETEELMRAYRARHEKALEIAKPRIDEAMEKLIDLIEFNDVMAALHDAVVKDKLEEFNFPEYTAQTRALMKKQLSDGAFNRREIYVPKVHRKPFSEGFRRDMERMMKGCLGEVVKIGEELDSKKLDIEKFRRAAILGQRYLVSQKRIRIGRLRGIWTDGITLDASDELPHPPGGPAILTGESAASVKAPTEEPQITASDINKLATLPPTTKNAVKYAEQCGIIFIDEIDKLIGKSSERSDATRQGVQRDLLPLLDGCIVKTGKYGPVDTSNMLFICSGAFQLNKPEELMVELQGRLPIRVHLDALSVEDFVSILRLKEENILDQYVKMMRTDGVDLIIDDSAVLAIAKAAFNLNLNYGNYGARRLYGCVEKVLEDVSYLSSPTQRITMTITEEYVANHLGKHA